jgi:hypothetical protein
MLVKTIYGATVKTVDTGGFMVNVLFVCSLENHL